jgi:hypothetical protein
VCNSFTSLLANYVYTKHTPLSFASWCMLHIHNSASLRGVCADTPLSFASLVYLLHIHNSAAPRLCIFPYTILSSDVRHYYTSSSYPALPSSSQFSTINLCTLVPTPCHSPTTLPKTCSLSTFTISSLSGLFHFRELASSTLLK